MTRKVFILISIIALILVVGYFYFTSDNTKDSRVWGKFLGELNENQVEKVIITSHPNREILLNETERKELLELLTESRFEISNRVGHGSTPNGNFLLIFKDRQVSVSYFGAENVSPRFELSPRHLDPKTQFYIENERLAKFIEVKLPK